MNDLLLFSFFISILFVRPVMFWKKTKKKQVVIPDGERAHPLPKQRHKTHKE